MNEIRRTPDPAEGPASMASSIPGQHYCLRWNNYQSNMTSVFHQLLRTEAFVDVTLACNDLSLKAHKVVLSACSAYFQKLLLENPCSHPTIIMPQDVCFADLQFIIEFVYRGEIDVSQEELQSLLKTADQLKIKGLCEVRDGGKDINTADIDPLALPKQSFAKVRRLSNINKRPHSALDCSTKISVTGLQDSFGDDKDLDDKSHLKYLVQDFSAAAERKANQIQRSDVGTSTDNDAEMPLVILESHHAATRPQAANMTNHGIMPSHVGFQSFFHGAGMCDEYAPEPPGPSATPVTEPNTILDRRDISDTMVLDGEVKIKFETLRAMDQSDTLDIDSHMSQHSMGSQHSEHSLSNSGTSPHNNHEVLGHSVGGHSMLVTPELLGLLPSSSHSDLISDMFCVTDLLSEGSNEPMMNSNGLVGHSVGTCDTSRTNDTHRTPSGPKTWSPEDMELALDALRNHNMSLTKASATYGIPSTTLWQRAHRLGIDTPKKEGPSKSWSEDSLNSALEALRTGTISANKASKAYGIPSSTLYKIARREGIRLAAPFNAAPTTWSPEDLERALEAIRSGQTSVQRASTEFGIPTGTLYGRCKREGIELSRSNPTPWSEDAMGEALEAVRVGQMSINQAAIHYNLPYSSLYGRFKRGKYDTEPNNGSGNSSNMEGSPSEVRDYYD